MDEAGQLLNVVSESGFSIQGFVDKYGLWAVGYLLAAYFIWQNTLLQRAVHGLLRDSITAQQTMTAAMDSLTEWIKEHRKS